MKRPMMILAAGLMLAWGGICAAEEPDAETAAQPEAEQSMVQEAETPAPPPPADFDEAAVVERCRAAARRLGAGLKKALMGAMKQGGPAAAIDVCNLEAPAIADTLAAELGLEVGRTSLRRRNPANAPDAWEQAALAEFAARVEAGEKPGELETGAVAAGPDGRPVYRWLRGIGTIGLCLRCHGAEMDADLADRIAQLYPEDSAVGFAAGDLRGAFTVTVPLD